MLRGIQVLAGHSRMAGVDVLRGAAIFTVVLFHFDYLPYGFLGVDLFFVISGFLVGRILIRKWRSGSRIEFSRFVLMRGIKIWPSYYAMLALGTLLAIALYRSTRPDQIIAAAHLPRYLFFFENYRGNPHWSFDHVWSLCVEEHFYIGLPIVLLVLQRLGVRSGQALLIVMCLGISAGVAAKIVGYSIGFETYGATHNRVDELSWGVLLATATEFHAPAVKALGKGPHCFVLGLLILMAAVLADVGGAGVAFRAVWFHSIVPVGFFLMLLNVICWTGGGSRVWLPIRAMGYYSYNWYLWHPVFVRAIQDHVGRGGAGLACYLAVSAVSAVVFTIAIEEPILSYRDIIVGRLLGPEDGGTSDRTSVAL